MSKTSIIFTDESTKLGRKRQRETHVLIVPVDRISPTMQRYLVKKGKILKLSDLVNVNKMLGVVVKL